jgi:hypothetical protein
MNTFFLACLPFFFLKKWKWAYAISILFFVSVDPLY